MENEPMEPLADDFEYEDHLLGGVQKGDGHYVLSAGIGCLLIDDPGFEPIVGQTVRYYGKGFGYIVRGVVIDGRTVRYTSPAQHALDQAEASRKYEEERRLRLAETKIPEVVTLGFEWTEDMRDISGFGGGYERACRQMISQGCAWWSSHPDADPKFHGFKEVMGICLEDNDDAKALSAAINAGIDGASGAMHQAAVSHVFQWRRLGSWLAYQTMMRDLAREEPVD